MSGRGYTRRIIAHHLIFTGYGHWLPNDPRGSGSVDVRKDELRPLGPAHLGRKREQPPKHELRRFYRDAEPRLEHAVLWFDTAKRQALGDAFGASVERYGYTCYACAVLRNHAHLLIRVHRDDAAIMWRNLANDTRSRLRGSLDVPDAYPFWADRPYKVFCYTPPDVWSRVRYIEDNPAKDHLPRQTWPFVTPYDNWPHHKQR